MEAITRNPLGNRPFFGAVILAFAAEQRPDLFKGLIMMDPPVLSQKIRWAMAISQFFGL